MNAQEVIDILNLEPLYDEGGYYHEIYRSAESLPTEALPGRYGSSRCFSTSIYYLITKDSFSAFHRLKSDEVFHFYLGDPVTMVQIQPGGDFQRITLGNDLRAGHNPQCVVPKGIWQGLYLEGEGEFALLGTTVSPGFEFEDFDLADAQTLLEQFPDEAEIIRKLTSLSSPE